MIVCLKSSSLNKGRKQTILSQVISHRSEYPVLESALWKMPAVSITSSMFFKDSGMASNYTHTHTGNTVNQSTHTFLTVTVITTMAFCYCGHKDNILLTNKSLDPACMYLSMKSKIVSQRAAKVGRDKRGERCCRKT